MTRAQAEKEARKRWGKDAYIRADEAQSSPERREEADRKWRTANEQKEAVEREINERLAACDWYQQLSQRRRELRKEAEAVQWWRCYYRFAVGKRFLGFHVEGSGDTWEEAFGQADKRAKATV